MTDVLWTGEASLEIAASPQELWGMLSDVTRMGEWSPICHRCEWLREPARPEVGARFVGHNRRGPFRWWRECRVTACEQGRVFAFSTCFRGEEQTRWRYELEPTPRGTRVTESYEVVSVPRWVRLANRLPGASRRSRRDARANLRQTLEHLRAAAER